MITVEDQSSHTAPCFPQMAVEHSLFRVFIFSERLMTSIYPTFANTDIPATNYLKQKVALKTVVR